MYLNVLYSYFIEIISVIKSKIYFEIYIIDVCETFFFDNFYFLDVFDESASRVGQNLFNFGVKTLGQICSTSGLSVKV